MVNHRQRGRFVENFCAVCGALVVMLYGVVEALVRLGFTGKHPGADGFPWWLVFTVTGLVSPKLLGRMTTGRIWLAFASKTPPPEAK